MKVPHFLGTFIECNPVWLYNFTAHSFEDPWVIHGPLNLYNKINKCSIYSEESYVSITVLKYHYITLRARNSWGRNRTTPDALILKLPPTVVAWSCAVFMVVTFCPVKSTVFMVVKSQVEVEKILQDGVVMLAEDIVVLPVDVWKGQKWVFLNIPQVKLTVDTDPLCYIFNILAKIQTWVMLSDVFHQLFYIINA